jgi:two-component system cell cycle response regulator
VRLASNVRAIDLPCRYGGEEFVVVMPDTQLADALRIAERIRMHVGRLAVPGGPGQASC